MFRFLRSFEPSTVPDMSLILCRQNKGAIMGCSNNHPHGQVWSLSEVPSLPAKELASLERYSLSGVQSSPGAPCGPHGWSDSIALEGMKLIGCNQAVLVFSVNMLMRRSTSVKRIVALF